MIWEMYQEGRIQNAESDARKARNTAEGAGDEIRQMRRQLEVLSLACQSLWELVRENTSLTEEELDAKILEIDGRDGLVDGKMSRQVIACSSCGRNTHSKRENCILCGASVERPHKFEG